jgi:hypothetical protein
MQTHAHALCIPSHQLAGDAARLCAARPSVRPVLREKKTISGLTVLCLSRRMHHHGRFSDIRLLVDLQVCCAKVEAAEQN